MKLRVPGTTSEQQIEALLASRGVPVRRATKCVYSIDGMTCVSCVNKIKTFVGAKRGVVSVEVSLEDREGVVWIMPSETTCEDVREAIDDMGFPCEVKGANSNMAGDSEVNSGTITRQDLKNCCDDPHFPLYLCFLSCR